MSTLVSPTEAKSVNPIDPFSDTAAPPPLVPSDRCAMPGCQRLAQPNDAVCRECSAAGVMAEQAEANPTPRWCETGCGRLANPGEARCLECTPAFCIYEDCDQQAVPGGIYCRGHRAGLEAQGVIVTPPAASPSYPCARCQQSRAADNDALCPACREIRNAADAQALADRAYHAAYARVVVEGPGGNLLRISKRETLPLAGLGALFALFNDRLHVWYPATARDAEDAWQVDERYAADVARVMGLEAEATQ